MKKRIASLFLVFANPFTDVVILEIKYHRAKQGGFSPCADKTVIRKNKNFTASV